MDTRYLEQRRLGWYAVRDVPAKLASLVGRKRLRVSLKTRDLRVAQHRRWAALTKLNDQITHAASKSDHFGIIAEALEIRRELEDPTPVDSYEMDDGTVENWTARDYEEEIMEAFLRDARRRGFKDTAMLEGVALGTATPIEPLIEQWIGEQDIEPRGKDDHRRATKELIEWAARREVDADN